MVKALRNHLATPQKVKYKSTPYDPIILHLGINKLKKMKSFLKNEAMHLQENLSINVHINIIQNKKEKQVPIK